MSYVAPVDLASYSGLASRLNCTVGRCVFVVDTSTSQNLVKQVENVMKWNRAV